MVEDAVESGRRTGDVFRLYAEIYALRLDQDVVSLAPSCPVVLPTLEDPGPGSAKPEPSPVAPPALGSGRAPLARRLRPSGRSASSRCAR